MTAAAVRPLDQPIDVAHGGGQVRPLTLIDQQAADDLEPLLIDGRSVHPCDQFDLVFTIHRSER